MGESADTREATHMSVTFNERGKDKEKGGDGEGHINELMITGIQNQDM